MQGYWCWACVWLWNISGEAVMLHPVSLPIWRPNQHLRAWSALGVCPTNALWCVVTLVLHLIRSWCQAFKPHHEICVSSLSCIMRPTPGNLGRGRVGGMWWGGGFSCDTHQIQILFPCLIHPHGSTRNPVHNPTVQFTVLSKTGIDLINVTAVIYLVLFDFSGGDG